MIKINKLLFALLVVFIDASSHDEGSESWVLAETQSPGRRALTETNTTIAPVPGSTSVKASGVPASTTVCCKAMTAQCLACASGVDVSYYCWMNPTTVGCEVFRGWCRYGDNRRNWIAGSDVSDVAACMAKCDSTTNCTYYAFDTKSSKCYTYSGGPYTHGNGWPNARCYAASSTTWNKLGDGVCSSRDVSFFEFPTLPPALACVKSSGKITLSDCQTQGKNFLVQVLEFNTTTNTCKYFFDHEDRSKGIVAPTGWTCKKLPADNSWEYGSKIYASKRNPFNNKFAGTSTCYIFGTPKCQCSPGSLKNDCALHKKCVVMDPSACPDSEECKTESSNSNSTSIFSGSSYSWSSSGYCSATPCKKPNDWSPTIDRRVYQDSGCTRVDYSSLKSGGSVLTQFTQTIPMNTCIPSKLPQWKYLSYKCGNHTVEDSKMVVIEQSYEDSNCSVQGKFRQSYKRGKCSGPVLGRYVIPTWSGKTPCGGISAEPQDYSSSNILFVGLSFLFSFIYLL